jgi:predicted DNA-binding transcriptional regulator AlpA
MRSLSLYPCYIAVSSDGRYLTAGQIRERYGVSAMWIYRYMARRGFPKPVLFGGPTSARHWLISDVERGERERADSCKRSQADTML